MPDITKNPKLRPDQLKINDLIAEDIKSGSNKATEHIISPPKGDYKETYELVNDATWLGHEKFNELSNRIKNSNLQLKNAAIKLAHNTNQATSTILNYLNGARLVDASIIPQLEKNIQNLNFEYDQLTTLRNDLRANHQDTSAINNLLQNVEEKIIDTSEMSKWVKQLHYVDKNIDEKFEECLLELRNIQAEILNQDLWKSDEEIELMERLLKIINSNNDTHIYQLANGGTIKSDNLDVLAIAASFLPYQDRDGNWHCYTNSDIYNIEEYRNLVGLEKGEAWCARFASLVLKLSSSEKIVEEIKKIGNCGSTIIWKKFFESGKHGVNFIDIKENDGYIPNAGEILFLKLNDGPNRVNHVGIVIGTYVDEKGNIHVLTIEGNRNSNGYDNYDKNIVRTYDYLLDDSQILGYGQYDDEENIVFTSLDV